MEVEIVAHAGENERGFWKSCPQCTAKQYYKTKKDRNRAAKDNNGCKLCARAKIGQAKMGKRALADGDFFRVCPGLEGRTCGRKIFFRSAQACKVAADKKVVCRACVAIKQTVPEPEEGWVRTCPGFGDLKCNTEMVYLHKKSKDGAAKRQRLCQSCGQLKRDELKTILEAIKPMTERQLDREIEAAIANRDPNFDVGERKWFRICHGIEEIACGKTLFYAGSESCHNAMKKNSICRSCTQQKYWAANRIPEPEGGYFKFCPGSSDRPCEKKQVYSGKGALITAIKANSKCIYCTAFINASARGDISGENNPNYGKNRYDGWVEKYGLEKANELSAEVKRNQSIKSSGANNPNYGKQAAAGAGNGWSGYYGSFYFRSLGELCQIIKMKGVGQTWVSGESIRISYLDHNKVEHTYSPDFITETEVIKCKPAKLHNTLKVQAKATAGKLWAENNGRIYVLVDPGRPA